MENPKINPKKKINIYRSPYVKHLKMLFHFEKQASIAFKIINKSIMISISDFLKSEKLIKSNNYDDLVKKASTIEINFDQILKNIINPHLKVLDWLMFGNESTDPEVIRLAKKIGVYSKVTPGFVPASYLHSIDTNRDYYKKLYDTDPKDFNTKSMISDIKKLTKTMEGYLDQFKIEYKNNMSSVIQNYESDVNQKNISKAQVSISNEKQLKDIEANFKDTLPKTKLFNDIKNINKKFEKKWNVVSSTNISKASSEGYVSSTKELFGFDDPDMNIAYITMEDERVTKFCKNCSRKADGTYKLYKISDFRPSGWNFGKPQEQWELSVTPAHYNCRSWMIYVPPGFTVTKGGILQKS